jgi:hypothetical protein
MISASERAKTAHALDRSATELSTVHSFIIRVSKTTIFKTRLPKQNFLRISYSLMRPGRLEILDSFIRTTLFQNSGLSKAAESK